MAGTATGVGVATGTWLGSGERGAGAGVGVVTATGVSVLDSSVGGVADGAAGAVAWTAIVAVAVFDPLPPPHAASISVEATAAIGSTQMGLRFAGVPIKSKSPYSHDGARREGRPARTDPPTGL